ncbi:hypothetical protein U9M48_040173 [Paspalum notatum var. saurae]|uniref:Uncharacterized protein n=1 Tax=Paspalum notatum var. saurae TaxID=547442 RepID=A0AAQ3XC45_PASNO
MAAPGIVRPRGGAASLAAALRSIDEVYDEARRLGRVSGLAQLRRARARALRTRAAPWICAASIICLRTEPLEARRFSSPPARPPTWAPATEPRFSQESTSLASTAPSGSQAKA